MKHSALITTASFADDRVEGLFISPDVAVAVEAQSEDGSASFEPSLVTARRFRDFECLMHASPAQIGAAGILGIGRSLVTAEGMWSREERRQVMTAIRWNHRAESNR